MRFVSGKVFVCFARIAAMAALLALPAAGASAAPISYNEAVSGDLPFGLPMGSPFNFDVGTNTVSGHTFMSEGGHPYDYDSFAFVIASGTQLTNITLSFASTIVDPASSVASIQYGLSPGNVYTYPATLGDSTFSLLAGSPGFVFGSALPLDAGTYGLSFVGSVSNFGFATDYTWTFTVEGSGSSTVPEPASLTLFGTGLLATVRSVRRRR